MKKRNSIKSDLYKPLKYFLLYICFTLSFSFWGPRSYFEYDRLSVFIYISAFLVIFSIGYYLGSSRPSVFRQVKTNKDEYTLRVPFLNTCIILTLLYATINFLSLLTSGDHSFSFDSIGQNYNDYYDAHNATKGTYNAQTILFFFMGFPKIVTLVLGVYYFNKLGKLYKISLISAIVLIFVTNTIGIGNQKSLGDIVIYSSIAFLVKAFDMSAERRKKMYYRMLIVITLFIVFISLVQIQRISALGFSSLDINQKMNARTSYDFDHPFFKIFGKQLGLGFANFITGYLSGGYYGLSLCMKLPFVWTYGIGSSYSLTLFFEKFAGADAIFNQTYLARMEDVYGWRALSDWNTIFPWLASDFTFVGALFLFIPVGYIYGVAWKEVVKYRNPISLLMFAMLTVCVIFIPANNQLLHPVDGFIATSIIFFVWKSQHKKYNVIPVRNLL